MTCSRQQQRATRKRLEPTTARPKVLGFTIMPVRSTCLDLVLSVEKCIWKFNFSSCEKTSFMSFKSFSAISGRSELINYFLVMKVVEIPLSIAFSAPPFLS